MVLAIVLSSLPNLGHSQDDGSGPPPVPPPPMNSCITRAFPYQPTPLAIDTTPLAYVQNVGFQDCLTATLNSGLLGVTSGAEGEEDLDTSDALRAFLMGAGGDLGGLNIAGPAACKKKAPFGGDKFKCSMADNQQLVDNILKGNEEARACLAGQEKSLQGLDDQLKCVKAQADQIRAVSDRVGEVFTNINTSVKQEISKYDNDDQNCESQARDLENKQREMAEAIKIASDVVASSNELVTNATTQLKAAEKAEKSLKEVARLEEARLANVCLSRPDPAYQCQLRTTDPKRKSTRSANIAEYAGCLVRRDSVLSKDKEGNSFQDGYRRNSKLAEGQDTASNVTDVIKQILSEMPSQEGDIPTAPSTDGSVKGFGKSFQILSAEDFMTSSVAQQLRDSKFNGKTNIYGLVENRVKFCFREARERVVEQLDKKSGKRNATSPLGSYQFAVEKARDDAFAVADKAINGFNQAIQTINTSLTDRNMPFLTLDQIGIPGGDLNRCFADYFSRSECMRRFQTGIRNTLDGTSQTARTAINIVGAQNRRVVGCTGLRGCFKALQNEQRVITQESQQNKQLRTAYTNDTNSKMKQFGKALASGVGIQIQQINQYLQRVNGVLGKLGVPAISFKNVQGEQLEDADKDGVLDPPADALKYLATQTSVPKIDTESFGPATKDIDKKKAELEKDLTEIEKANSEVLAKAAECLEKSGKKVAEGEKLQELWNKLCREASKPRPQPLSDLEKALRNADLIRGSGNEVSVTLDNGIASDTAAKIASKKSELEATKKSLEEAKKRIPATTPIPSQTPNPSQGSTEYQQKRIDDLNDRVAKLEMELAALEEKRTIDCTSISEMAGSKAQAIASAAKRAEELNQRLEGLSTEAR